MPKNETKLLKYITTHYNIEDLIYTRDIYDKLEMSPSDINSICDFLNQQGVFDEYVRYKDESRAFVLTYATFVYKRNKKNELIKYILSSIVVPIIVGTTSAVVSSIIRSIFQLR